MQLESHMLYGRNDERPSDGATQIPWKGGRFLAWDATCPSTYARHVHANSRKACSAATGNLRCTRTLRALTSFQSPSSQLNFCYLGLLLSINNNSNNNNNISNSNNNSNIIYYQLLLLSMIISILSSRERYRTEVNMQC